MSGFLLKKKMNGRSIKINRVPAAVTVILVMCALVYIFSSSSEERPHMYGMLRNHNKVNLRKLLIGGIQAAQRGGLEILEVARSQEFKERSKGKTDEGANDPLTAADSRSHCVMKVGLHRIFPRITIFSEEDREHCGDSGNTFDLDPTVLHETAVVADELVNVDDVTVWIDPLDATQEFTEHLYEYVTTMVCVAVRGKPVIGVIHRPFIGQTAWAWVDHSMSEYLTSIRSDNPDVRHPIVVVSRSHAGGVKDLTRTVFGEQSTILVAAGAGYKVLQVVANNATAYLHSTKIKKWDICAGDAILRALGGTMTTLNNEYIDYGPDGSPVNSDGLFAAIMSYEEYIKKIIALRNTESSPS